MTRPIARLVRPTLAVYACLLFLSTHWPRLDIRVNQTQSLGDVNLDKPVHALALAGLTALFILARPAGRRASWLRQVAVGTLAAGAYAYFDELTQQFFGRTTSTADLLADLAGISVVTITWLACLRSQPGISGENRVRTGAKLLLAMFLPVVFILAGFKGMAFEVDWSADLVRNTLSLWDAGRVAALVAGAAFFTLLWLGWPTTRRSLGRRLIVAWLVGATLLVIMAMRNMTAREAVCLSMGLMGVATCALVIIAMRIAQQSVAPAPPPEFPPESPETPPEAPPEAISTAIAKPAQQAQKQFVGHAKVVSILTLVSRVTGLARESVLAAVFGLSSVSAAFVFAFQIPNLFRRLFGEGALSAALIPVYARLLKEDPAIARRFVWLCLSLLVVILAGLTILGEAALLALLAMRDWSPEMALALRLTMVMLPYMPLVCLVALIGAVLQVRGKFASTAATPIVLNLVVVAGALWATWDASTPQAIERSVYWVSGSVLLAGLLQVAWQAIGLLGMERPTFHFAGTRPAMASLKAIFLPMVIGLAAFQLNTFMDSMMAMALSAKADASHMVFNFNASESPGRAMYTLEYPLQEAAVAALNWSQRLYEFPLGIFGIAIATAIFPALSHAAASRGDQGLGHFTTIFRHGLRLSVFIGLPASVGLMIVALPLSRLAYERGEFTLADSQRVAWILLGYAPAIWAYSMNHVLARAFYALGDSRTPLKVSLSMVALNFTLNLILVWPLGAMGFAIATAAGAILQNVILIRAMGSYLHQPMGREVWQSWGRSLLASLIMAGALIPLMMHADVANMPRRDSAMVLTAAVLGGALAYLGSTWLLGCPEIRWLLKRKAA